MHDADAAAYERARRPKAGKLRCRPELLAAVQRGSGSWSPEQVSQRLRLEYPDDPSMWVSHETIYRAFYRGARGGSADG